MNKCIFFFVFNLFSKVKTFHFILIANIAVDVESKVLEDKLLEHPVFRKVSVDSTKSPRNCIYSIQFQEWPGKQELLQVIDI